MSTVIQIEHISKLYKLGQISTGTLAYDLNKWWAQVRGKEDPTSKISFYQNPATQKDEEHWALKDISLSIEEGEVLGIIGKNGAGKSTLLKILSKVTAPTSGTIKIKGRIASLLEVGTGFHPELTGRENIFLNGAILGMNNNEIKSKLDEIIDFSGVEKFIDTPVKRYSSGMYVRLAFAVAAHLDPEILIVDEVLAVGDAEFQKKCLGKMSDVAKGGRTILFVSHNMAAIQTLCNSAIILSSGNLVSQKDNTINTINKYTIQTLNNLSKTDLNFTNRSGNGKIQFTKLEIVNKNNEIITNPISGQFIKFLVYFKSNIPVSDVDVSISINSLIGENKTVLWSKLTGETYNQINKDGIFYCEIEKLALTEGEYVVNLFSTSNGEILDWLVETLILKVENGDFFNTGVLSPSSHQSVIINHKWY